MRRNNAWFERDIEENSLGVKFQVQGAKKKLYTRDDGGGVQLTLYVWRELGLEKIQLHTAVRVTACVQCVHFVRSTSRN